MSPTIKEQSEQVRAATAERLPAEAVATFTHDRKAMLERGVPANAVAPGDLLQDFTLPNATGTNVSLSQLVADGPAVLVFYRGSWCPYCNLALHQYQAELVPQLARFGARLAVISPQTPDESLTAAEKQNLQFPVPDGRAPRVLPRELRSEPRRSSHTKATAPSVQRCASYRLEHARDTSGRDGSCADRSHAPQGVLASGTLSLRMERQQRAAGVLSAVEQ